jgi:hypothetical protein
MDSSIKLKTPIGRKRISRYGLASKNMASSTQKVAKNRILEVLLFRISPITAHYAGYPNMSEDDQIAWARLATHDNLTDFHKHYTSVRRIKRVIQGLGGINQIFCIMPYTIEVRYQKPAGDKSNAISDKPVIRKLKGSKVVSG